MSYAIEAKKRKFDRILESLTDGATSQSRNPLNSRNNAPISDGQPASLDGSKRRRVTPTSNKPAHHASLTGHYLPSSRAAFLERLETFRHVTKWHIPSTATINAAAWAKRGWTCVDTDIVSCGSCKERVTVNLDVEDSRHISQDSVDDENGQSKDDSEGTDMAVELYDALLKRYQDMIVTSHTENCPWRKRGCDASIQRIEGLLNTGTTVNAMNIRYNSIIERPDEVPQVTKLPTQTRIDAEHNAGSDKRLVSNDVSVQETMDIHDGELENLELNSTTKSTDAVRLAMCGWQRKDIDVIECRHCFRSLGLWLYRGEEPSMENLDPIDSHLDYCPWRSAEAQDTEITFRRSPSDTTSLKTRIPGWVLVYLVVVKQNAKKRGESSRNSTPVAIIGGNETNFETSLESVSPEQREKKMKDLMRRINAVKKPFNVKAFLRSKKFSAAN